MSHPKVEQYIKQKQAQEQNQSHRLDEQWSIYRQNVLICAGLYDKIYGGANDPNFPYKEWDKHNRQYRYYKVVPLAVTDEEFAQIEQYSVIAKPL